jgi:hypothetical protein
MHSTRSVRTLLAGLGLAAFSIGFVPGPASAALPLPGTKQTFRLFSRAISFLNVNRVYCGMNVNGNACVDSAGRGTVQGGFWPRGSNDNYVFNSGLQVAGVIAGAKSPANPWGGDTTGGWFFDGAGGRVQTEGVAGAAPAGCTAKAEIYQSFNAADVACWPLDAYVPQGDFVEDVYAEPLRGLVAASQGDVHWLSWEGNPALNRVRLHPLGVLVDYRFLAWNYPAGAQDIIFLVATFYNITSKNPADYAQHRPGIRQVLIAQGEKFQALNNAAFGVTLPEGGYTISPAYAAIAADHDVGQEGSNYNAGNLPFAMGWTYEGLFSGGKAGWTFDPSIFAPPFFKGVGFIGMKYLRGPQGTADDPKGAINLLSSFCNGNSCGAPGTGNHADPGTTIQNFRQMAGTPGPTDGQCNYGNPAVTHVCFIHDLTQGVDIRIFESSDSMTLKPGDGKVIVIAYIFAPPVLIPGYTPPTSSNQYGPGNVIWNAHPDSMAAHNGVTKVDSISGFLHYNGPQKNADGSEYQPNQLDYSVVKGSLLDKALVAQAVFDSHFLQEFAPEAPPFFLIPGDKQVTILWKQSATETIGDPFFQVVGNPTKVVNGVTITNPLYDPNYRKFDVEGYRIYRGRSDTPSALKLLVQYDYAGTTFKDFTGVVVNGNCAPELGIGTDCPATSPAGGLPTNFTPTPTGLGPAVAPGTAFTRSVTYNIGPQLTSIGALIASNPLVFFDQASGNRKALAGGLTTITLVADTAISGGNSGFPPLADTGVPFIFIDKAGNCPACGVSNGVTYFYSVTAFDVNAPGHGPTSLESAKVTKQVVPQPPAGNFNNTAATQSGVFGRTGLLTDNVLPTIDPVTGAFNKKFPPTNAVALSLAGFAPQLLNGTGSVGVQYDSTTMTAIASAGNVSVLDWYTEISSSGSTSISIPTGIPFAVTNAAPIEKGTFTALSVDSALAAVYGGGAGFTLSAAFTVNRPGSYWTGTQGRGCINGVYTAAPAARAGQCTYTGPRWFVGDNEAANPEVVAPLSFVNDPNGVGIPNANYNNAGVLPGVVTAFFAQGGTYFINAPWRDIDNALSPYVTAADYKLYWGAAGVIDSVIDITHDEPVPFKPTVGASWGVLNSSGAPADAGGDTRAEITAVDIQCVPPLRNFSVSNPAPACTKTYAFENTAKPGPIAFFNGATANAKTAPAAANPGFMLYLKGHEYIFELSGGAVPAAGTVWTARDLVGIVYGGVGPAADQGPYLYIPSPLRPFTAPGAAAKFSFTVANELLAVDATQLAKVHTVPDPYYVTSAFDLAVNSKDIQFVNVPINATIRIYTTSGVLVRVLQNTSTTFGGTVHWDVRNRTNQYVSSGVYFYNVESGGLSQTGRMTIVNYASTVQ